MIVTKKFMSRRPAFFVKKHQKIECMRKPTVYGFFTILGQNRNFLFFLTVLGTVTLIENRQALRFSFFYSFYEHTEKIHSKPA
jgi:hypothetical protein